MNAPLETVPIQVEGDDWWTLGTLPAPATLNDELLDMCQLAAVAGSVGVPLPFDEDDKIKERLDAWEAAVTAEWKRRGLDVLVGMVLDIAEVVGGTQRKFVLSLIRRHLDMDISDSQWDAAKAAEKTMFGGRQ